MSTEVGTRRFYFAGELFDHKHLLGNHGVAAALEQLSGGRWQPLLPQLQETAALRGVDIRNLDFAGLFACDAMVANFDGTDLDSGTVVEFAYAKMLDIPTVLLRTDFRGAGDQGIDGDPWNLMCSGYPRSRSVILNAIALYQHHVREGFPASLERAVALPVLAALDEVCALPSLFGGDPEQARAVYSWAVRSCGGGLEKLLPARRIEEILERKKRNGMLE